MDNDSQLIVGRLLRIRLPGMNKISVVFRGIFLIQLP